MTPTAPPPADGFEPHAFVPKRHVKDGICHRCAAHYDDVVHRVEELDEREERLLREQAVKEDTGYGGDGRLHGWGLLTYLPEGVRLTRRGRAWLAAHPVVDHPAAHLEQELAEAHRLLRYLADVAQDQDAWTSSKLTDAVQHARQHLAGRPS